MQYRAKRKSDRSWTEGALIPYGNEPKIIHAISVHPEFAGSENVYYCEGSPVDQDTVCRFTGMHDNTDWDELTPEEQALFLYPEDGSRHHKDEWRGKKIYENDIVRVTDDDGNVSELNSDTGLGRVVFCFGMWYITNGIENSLFEISSGYYVRVIGNVFDSPELWASLNHNIEECWRKANHEA